MSDHNDIFGSDDDDENEDNHPHEIPSSSSSSQFIQSQTQPEVNKMVSDIFWDSDEDDENENDTMNGNSGGGHGSYEMNENEKWNRIHTGGKRIVSSDDIFASDSDDDENDEEKKNLTSSDLLKYDSDSENDDNEKNKNSFLKISSSKKKKKKEKNEKNERKKRKREERENRKAKKREKRLKKSSSSSRSKDGSSSSSDKKASGYDSGDSYDSGGEVERTADDDKFIDHDGDDDSDLDGYGGPQKFKDSRPNKKVERKKEMDPVTETIEYMKKKKALVLTDTQKNQIAVDLRTKMIDAAKQDEDLITLDQPAITKLNLLSTVQRVMGLKLIQNQLLDNHILDALNLWIEPKGDHLTSLSVRTAIYDILKGLPCQIDHLRGSQIGKTVLALRKHKKEIPENKRLLKEIMEKWARPIFSLSSDARGEVHAPKPELAHILKTRLAQKSNQSFHATDGSERRGEFSFDEQVAGKIRKKEDGLDRVRAPVSDGHMFTVRPTTSADFEDKKSMNNIQSVTTQKLKSKLKDLKAMVRKDPHSAINVVLNGRDKS